MGALGAHGFEGAASLNAKEEDLVMQEMSHFVSNLEQFVVDRLLFGAWMQLEQVRVRVPRLGWPLRRSRAGQGGLGSASPFCPDQPHSFLSKLAGERDLHAQACAQEVLMRTGRSAHLRLSPMTP